LGISKTISGLLVREELDSESGWSFHDGPLGPATHLIDTSVKVSGSGSSKMSAVANQATEMYKDIDLGTGASRRISIWHKQTENNPGSNTEAIIICHWNASPPIYNSGFDEWIPGPAGHHETTIHDWTRHTAILSHSGVHTVVIHGDPCFIDASYCDKLTVQQSDVLTLGGLVQGQKAELYRTSDDTKLDTQTCAAGETTVTFDVSAEDCPTQLYFKIYATNGSTLIETTTSYELCGGDTWEWTADAGTLSLTRDGFIIYRGAASVTPRSTIITANLKTPAGADYPAALITFSAANGTVSPSSGTTDANGNVETTLTSLTTAFGLAVVKAQWLGDRNVPACSAYIVVHVFYDAEVPSSTVAFQLYVEGYPLEFVSGKYGINAQGKPETIQVEIPEWDSNLVPFGLMNVYRKGVQEFAGVYLVPDRHLSDAPRVTLQGQDLSFLLLDRVVDLKIYNGKTPQYIINDLLTSFDCGITPGSLGSCASTLTITITSETLLAAIQRVCDGVCWTFRLNLNRTLDFAEIFSGSPSGAAFTEGIDIFDLDASPDYSKIANWVRMVGDGIVSTKQDGTNIMAQGPHQIPSFQTSISSQSTLDIACQALLDLLKDSSEAETLLAYDAYAPGAFQSEDTVTVTAPSVDMAGQYQVKRVERDMTDPNFVLLELSNRLAQYWELDEAYRRMIKDLSI
jgi:hypothetical protein